MKLTKEEKAILKSLNKKWKWMARDRDGILYFYNKKPIKLNTIWNIEDYGYGFGDLSHLFKSKTFSFITWDDEEPTSIDELLGSCEVQEETCKLVPEVFGLIDEYAKKHELAKICGSEYIQQDDNARIDAIDLVCDIFDKYVEIYGG